MAFESMWAHILRAVISFGMGSDSLPLGELPPGVQWDSTGQYRYVLEHDGKKYPFNLMDPGQSPENIRAQVVQGYKIFTDTPTNAPEFVGNGLTCNNCHFVGGNTLGGLNGGISLVGVTSTYPRYIKRFDREITIEERIQSCFLRSLNGKAPPVDSTVMQTVVAYLKWISSEADPLPIKPWLGLKALPEGIKGNKVQGATDYWNKCASCHRPDGQGTTGVPAVWGDQSFNDSAGMHSVPTMASFIKANMPHGNPILTDQQAMNIAEFISEKLRPHFKEK
ncbi:MAG: c-type cytochrome [Parachlamydiales bacterium]|jgi:thiosulfate dehydrogenase